MNQNYKLIISDLDRTLLKDDKTIPESTVKVIERCKQQNIRFAIATARPIRSIQEYQKILPCDAVIALNGAIVAYEGKTVYYPIDSNRAADLIKKILEKDQRWLSAEIEDSLYANFDGESAFPSIYYSHFPLLPPGRMLKILVEFKGEKTLHEVNDLLHDDLYATIANQKLIQIMNKKATKWNGICQLLDHWGIESGSAMYFGDDYDDLEPIRKCGTGIAVKNAIDPVLQTADFITGSNEEGGVEAFLLRHILGN